MEGIGCDMISFNPCSGDSPAPPRAVKRKAADDASDASTTPLKAGRGAVGKQGSKASKIEMIVPEMEDEWNECKEQFQEWDTDNVSSQSIQKKMTKWKSKRQR